ncbi:hypothetical protein Hamer_G025745 [Homarus americanus]|uniref:Uncharacterized protein n=1 Tax=Homarus americanus TaxID=6706 RepID=A0A8J5TI14_HOMAM|nr:hypothetical protein Hamer_G025745 [Homarus americanus]
MFVDYMSHIYDAVNEGKIWKKCPQRCHRIAGALRVADQSTSPESIRKEGVPGKRENNSHIDCGCPREKKIPVLELEFIKAQRTKAEGQGSMQMGSIDYSETKKQIANAKKREQIREREQKKKMKSEEAIQREEELCRGEVVRCVPRVTVQSESHRAGHRALWCLVTTLTTPPPSHRGSGN